MTSVFYRGGGEPGARRDLIFWPTSDFGTKEISKMGNIKTSCNYEIRNKLFYQKIDFVYNFIAISSHFVFSKTVLLRRECM
jgi:hypothetical protein